MTEDIITPIQLIGTQRSGSNLLRLMLNQLTEITAPHPPHILKTFVPLMDRYGDLSINANFQTLINDVCEFVELNPVKWNDLFLDRALIFERLQNSRSIYSLFEHIYASYASSKGSRFWCCKSLTNVHFVEELHSHGIKPYYIHLYRDGRDVALSFKKIMVGEKHTYHQAKNWKRDQNQALAIAEKLGPDRVIRVAYEDLITNPEAQLSRICAFLHIEFKPQALDYFLSSDSRETALSGKMWQNVTKPVLRDNMCKYLKELPREDVLIFEAVAGDVLERLGYPLHYGDTAKSVVFSETDLIRFERENDFLKKRAVEHSDALDRSKRMPQEQLLSRIKLAFEPIPLV
ncbi:MAG: sulfotransferase [Marinoscillum sp.]|uniref:sulfotransferase family protein n=1 Tax=Marinoscillum sp. TaxID=2024838 RepID=UPI0032FD299D